MKKILLVFVLLLTSCTSNNKIAEDQHINPLFTNLNQATEVPAFTASDTNVYFIDRGRIYTFDINSESAFELVTLDVIDDNPLSLESYISSDQSEYEKYSDLVFPEFLQVYDDKLYYISEYFNTEGENKIKLYQLDLKGQNKKEILTFDTVPYHILISHGMLFFRSTSSNGLFKANLNTKEVKEVKLDDGYAFLDYVVSNEKLGANLINTVDGSVSLSMYDFNQELFKSESLDKFPYSSSMYEDIKSNYLLNDGKFETVIYDGETELSNLGKLRVDYIDDKYVYTGTVESPVEYKIYTHNGTVQKEFTSPFEFVDTSLFSGAFGDMSQSNILGIFKNHLVVMGNTKDKGINVYLVSIDSGEWRLIHDGHYNVKE